MTYNKDEIYAPLLYRMCLYSGISDKIDYEINYGKTDLREALNYCVEKYCKEEVMSGASLRKKLAEYNIIAAKRFDNCQFKAKHHDEY